MVLSFLLKSMLVKSDRNMYIDELKNNTLSEHVNIFVTKIKFTWTLKFSNFKNVLTNQLNTNCCKTLY